VSSDDGDRRFRHRTPRGLIDGVTPVWGHEEDAQAFLTRHEAECSRLDRFNSTQRQSLLSDLLRRIANTLILWLAVRRTLELGRKAPGPNGERLATLWRRRRWYVSEEIRRLSGELRAGTYRPGGTRKVEISKGPGRGTRTLRIPNWQDAVVQRAIVMILEPLVDPHFHPLSVGFRPGRGQMEALGLAALAAENGQRIWMTADLRNAFDNVPRRALLAECRRAFGRDAVKLFRRIIQTDDGHKGIPQGGPLSPMLLNLWADRSIDWRWAEGNPNAGQLRWADDFLAWASNDLALHAAGRELERLATSAGFELKEPLSSNLKDLSVGETVEWLGMEVSWTSAGTRFEFSPKRLQRIRETIRRKLMEVDGPHKVNRYLQGVFAQSGAAFHEDWIEVVRDMAKIAWRLGHHETPSLGELWEIWRLAGLRFLALKALLRLEGDLGLTERARGFAAGHANRTNVPVFCSQGGGRNAAALLFRSETGLTGDTIWAIRIQNLVTGHVRRILCHDKRPATPSSVVALRRGLAAIEEGSAVSVINAPDRLKADFAQRHHMPDTLQRMDDQEGAGLWRQVNRLAASRWVEFIDLPAPRPCAEQPVASNRHPLQ
jgi:RNA-directed DNA polymerase